MAFKNLIHDYYSREMSKETADCMAAHGGAGQYNSNYALYGYRKSEEDKHKLLIEPEEAAVVKEIFDMKIAGTRNDTDSKGAGMTGEYPARQNCTVPEGHKTVEKQGKALLLDGR